jgi:hypothetical protein
MRAIRTSGLTSGDWKRSHGLEGGTGTSRKRPVNSNSPEPTATAPVVDSTHAPALAVHANLDGAGLQHAGEVGAGELAALGSRQRSNRWRAVARC